ncbi:hypothetical protein DFO73_11714 [Cytobacillus oceanisediminis]|uniref:Uncharacterized protein n=1 Tax=Cytobacillus oceanisediminis TaxID=665099 RepID=A0A2V2ZJ89_9BACI|nr:hypothetical protein DFO73_11714 [Cytobacillus oceanisediminis]
MHKGTPELPYAYFYIWEFTPFPFRESPYCCLYEVIC